GPISRSSVPQTSNPAASTLPRFGSTALGSSCLKRSIPLHLRQRHAALSLVFAAAIFVRGFADFVGFEEDHLGDALVGVDLCGQWRGVGELERYVAFPFRFEWGDVYKNSAACISALAETDREDIARDPEVFNCAREGETVRWNDYRLTFEIDEVVLVKLFRIDDRAVDVCEEFELVSTTNVVAITRRAIRNDSLAIDYFNLAGFVWLDHSVLRGHSADPF